MEYVPTFTPYLWPRFVSKSYMEHLGYIMSSLSGGWFGTFFLFPYIGNFIIPIDELIFLERVETTNQSMFGDTYKHPYPILSYSIDMIVSSVIMELRVMDTSCLGKL